MVVDLEVLPLPDGRNHLRFQAEIQLDDPVALRAGEVMVVMIALTQAERMRTVGELDPIEHLHLHELVDGPIDRCSPDMRVCVPQRLQELVGGKCRAGVPQADQVLCDCASGLGLPFSELLERFVDSSFDVH